MTFVENGETSPFKAWFSLTSKPAPWHIHILLHSLPQTGKCFRKRGSTMCKKPWKRQFDWSRRQQQEKHADCHYKHKLKSRVCPIHPVDSGLPEIPNDCYVRPTLWMRSAVLTKSKCFPFGKHGFSQKHVFRIITFDNSLVWKLI